MLLAPATVALGLALLAGCGLTKAASSVDEQVNSPSREICYTPDYINKYAPEGLCDDVLDHAFVGDALADLRTA